MPCKRIKGIAYTDTYIPDKNTFSRIRCKQWTCAYCASRNRSQWRAVLTKYLRDDERQWSFMTVTVPKWVHNLDKSEDEKTEISARFIQSNWNSLITEIKRQYGKCDFVRVIERHKTGVLHLHILISLHADSVLKTRDDKSEYWHSERLHRILCPTRNDENKKRKNRKSWGYVHDWRNIETKHKSIMYITKYMTKREDIYETISKTRKLRVIQTSRGIKYNPETSPHDWKMKSAIYHEDLDTAVWHDLNMTKDVTPEDLKPYYPLPEEYGD